MGPEGDLVAIRLQRRCRCFGAWSGDQLVAYGWLSSGPEWIGELGLEIRPGPGEAYVWNCVTLPDQRRRGVFRNLLQCVVRTAAEEGLQRLWIGSIEDYADRAIVDAGFRPILMFEAQALAGYKRLLVAAADDADRELVDAAFRALTVTRGESVRRVMSRRH